MSPLTFSESPWRFTYKVTRIEQCIIAGISTWLIALLSNGPLWFNTPKVTAAACMFFGVVGASVLHYGRRADVYKKKHWDLVLVEHPRLLMILGCIAFGCSILIAKLFLPTTCVWIALFNVVAILLYANCLDQYWPIKNVIIALVCTTPVLMGWFSGHRMHPIVPFLIAAIAGIYLAREIMKDVVDRRANLGMRFTMVMSLGIEPTLRIAGVILIASISILICAGQYLPIPRTAELFYFSKGDFLSTISIAFFMVGIFFPLHLGWKLAKGMRLENYYRYVDGGMLGLMISVLGIRAGF